jgi:hypothetical protein
VPGSPSYCFDTFVRACSIRGAVFFFPEALKDAESDFNLRTAHEVTSFIANGGLEGAAFHSSTPFRLNNQDCGAMVDSYFFYSGPVYGYLAFFLRRQTSKWIVKSFKKNDQPDPRNLPFLRAFSGIGGLIDGKK